MPALVALGVASAYYFAITGTFWAVTGEFARWGGHVIFWFGYTPEEWGYFKLIGLSGTPLDRIDGVMIISMLLGALCAALWANNVSLRWPTSKRCLLQGLIGGIVASFGAWLAMGCNLAGFFTGIPMFSLQSRAVMLATVGGAWIGVKICLLPGHCSLWVAMAQPAASFPVRRSAHHPRYCVSGRARSDRRAS